MGTECPYAKKLHSAVHEIYILKRGENNYKKHYQLGGWKGKTHVAHQSPCSTEV